MKRILKKSKKEIINNNSLISVVKLFILIILLTSLLNIFRTNLYSLLVQNNFLQSIWVQKFWQSQTISNFSLYIFTAQIAMTVLVGTAVSFIAHMLENKHYGYKIKELLIYRFDYKSKIIIDFVLENFLLIPVSLLLLLFRYSEVALAIVLIQTFSNTLKVFIIIFDMFFNEDYLKKYTVKIIKFELDSVKKAQNDQNFDDVMSSNYLKVEKILNKMKKHTIEMLKSSNFDGYMDNMDFVFELGTKLNVNSTDDIMTSILYAGYVQDISDYLYENKYNKQIEKLVKHKMLSDNCDPNLLKIDDIKVRDMYSSHYCTAFLKINRYLFFSHLYDEKLNYNSSIKPLINSFNLIFSLSSKFDNATYSRINCSNWVGFIVKCMKYTENYDEKNENKIGQRINERFILEIFNLMDENIWVTQVLKEYKKISFNEEYKKFIETKLIEVK